MKTVEIIGYKRANLGKSEAKRLRADGNVPCVLYGGDEQIHFYAPMILFKELVYTAEAHFVNLNIEGHEVQAILQDIQFHPVSEVILHADFLQLFKGKYITMNIPVRAIGTAPGIMKGGKLIRKLHHLVVKALPKNMPEYIEIDVSGLDLGKSLKVREVKTDNFEILNSPQVSITGVEVPRALRGKSADEEEGGEEGGDEAASEGDSGEE